MPDKTQNVSDSAGGSNVSSNPRLGRRRATVVTFLSSYAVTAIMAVKNFALVPLYFHYFSSEVYGAWLASANVIHMLAILEFGLSSVLYQRLAHTYGARRLQEFAETTAAGLAAHVVVALSIGTLGWVLAPVAVNFVNTPQNSVDALRATFRLTSIGTALTIVSMALLAVPAAWQKASIGATSRILSQLLEVVGVVVFLLSGFGVLALGLGALIGALTGFLVGSILTVRGWVRLAISTPRLKLDSVVSIVRASLSTSFSKIAVNVADNIQITLAARFLGPQSAVILGLMDRLYKVLQTLINPIAGSAMSGIAHLHGEGGEKRASGPILEVMSLWLFAIVLMVPALIAVNPSFMALWVGPEMFGGIFLNAAVALAAIMSTRVFLFHMSLIAVGEIRRGPLLIGIEALLRIPVSILALFGLGIIGLPLSAFGGKFVLTYFFQSRLLADKLGQPLKFMGGLRTRGTVLLGASCLLAIGASGVIHLDSWLKLAMTFFVLAAGTVGLSCLADASIRANFRKGLALVLRVAKSIFS